MSEIYSNANDTAKAIKRIIDSFWKQDITKEQAASYVNDILKISENRSRVFRGDKFTAVFENTLGKRRLVDFNQMYYRLTESNQVDSDLPK
jgi:uncharacterized protein (TIGR04540 family)